MCMGFIGSSCRGRPLCLPWFRAQPSHLFNSEIRIPKSLGGYLVGDAVKLDIDRLIRGALIIAGTFFVGLGVLGIFLPIFAYHSFSLARRSMLCKEFKKILQLAFK